MKKFLLPYLKYNSQKKKDGFSLVEILIVISIFGMIAGAAFINMSSSRNKATLGEAQASMVNALELARNRAATGVGTQDHHNVSIDPAHRSFSIDGVTTTLSSVSFCTSTTSFTFNRLSATSSFDSTNNNTICLQLNGATTTIFVNKNGLITPQKLNY